MTTCLTAVSELAAVEAAIARRTLTGSRPSAPPTPTAAAEPSRARRERGAMGTNSPSFGSPQHGERYGGRRASWLRLPHLYRQVACTGSEPLAKKGCGFRLSRWRDSAHQVRVVEC